MSHGPCGLGGAPLAPLPAWPAIVNEAPMSVRVSASITTILVLVFMFVLILPRRDYSGSDVTLSQTIVSACFPARKLPEKMIYAHRMKRSLAGAVNWIRSLRQPRRPEERIYYIVHYR